MTDAEINMRLALAIGWKESDFQFPLAGSDDLYLPGELGFLCEFSYTDPAVIWPIAERFDAFPTRWDVDGPEAWQSWCDEKGVLVYGDTAAKAVALAVIKSKGA